MFKRKHIFTFVLLLLALIARPDELLEKAEKAYEGKDYKKAIACYEQLVKQGYTSPKLFYNLGNAYYRNNQLGKAIYNYELAKKSDPKDEDINNNLTIAYAKTVDKIETKENFFVSAVKSNVLNSFSTTAWAWLSIFGTCLTLLFIYLFISGVSVAFKRFSFFMALILLIGSLIVYFLGYSALQSKQQTNFAIITAEQTKVYVEPTATAASKFGLHEGTRVRILELNADWVLIKLENGNEGWLRAADVGVF
ncbi:MAG: tetratricopeptide repeat protein [Bacteroidia bacterium]